MSAQNERFPSLLALQEQNDRLLDALDTGQSTDGFWDEVTAFIQRAQTTGAILDIANERRAAQSILDYWDNALYREDRPAPGARLAEFDINLAPDLKDQPCPYRGLAAFDEQSAEFFFGRRALIGQMIAKVKGGARLMVVVGPSGSGKSSVVRAGLLRTLKQNDAIPGAGDWRYVSMVPGAEPVENLDRALEQAAPALDQRIVLVVDQFEEVFTVCEDPQARLDFEARLIALLETPDPEHIVILTLREDFVDNLSQLGQLYARYRQPGTRVNVEAMDVNELREVIEGPAAMVGLRFEEGVVDDLASKVLGERAGLPLLQFTLLQLWEKRRRNRVTKEVYEDVGSPLKALAKSADRFYEGLLPQAQTTARMILLEMVHPGEGKEFTSNRVPLENVFGGKQAPERVEEVVYRLICEARLVKLTGTNQDICGAEFGYEPGKLRALMAEEKTRGNVLQIEAAHEALVRNWPQLETWLEEERKTLQARWDFRRQAERWEGSGEKSEWLARGAALEAAAAWPNLSALEHRYIRKGRRAEVLDRALRIGGLVALIAGALLTVAMLWQVERVRRLQVGISRTAAQALIAEDKELEERLGWALKAYVEQDRLDDDRIANILGGLHLLTASSADAEAAEGLSVESALRSALKDAPVAVLHRYWNDALPLEVGEIIASPDRRRLATLSLPEESLGLVPALWDWETRQQQIELRPEVVAPTGGESGLVFNDDGSIVAGIGVDGAVYVWNTRDGAQIQKLAHDSPVARIWLGPAEGGRLASYTTDPARLYLWDIASGRKLWELDTAVWPPQLAFSADGARIAAAVEPASLCLIDAAAAEVAGAPACVSVALPEDAFISDLTGCPRDECFYVALTSGQPQVCDDSGCRSLANTPVSDGNLGFPPQPYCTQHAAARGEGGPVVLAEEDIASPGQTMPPASESEERVIMAAHDDTSIQAWDVTDPFSPTLELLLLSPTRVQGVLLRSDCNVLGTVGEAGGTLFDAMSGAILAESSIEPGDARQLYNIGDGIGIASADTDEAIRLWGFARTGESEPLWRGPDRDARSISPDGGWAATMIGNVVTLTELASGESRSIALGSAQEGATLSDTAEDILVGPNGRTLLWRAFDGSARLMDTTSGAELARFADAPALRAFGMTETALAAAGTDGVIRLWSTADPNGIDVSHPMTIALPVGDVRALGLSQDGNVLATSSKDGVQVWRLQGTGSAAKLPIPVAAQALALNHDGSRVAMMHANPDGSLLPIPLTVWDTSTGQQVAEMSVARALPAVAFSGGEREDLIVAQGGEGVITVGRYFITVEELARRAAQVAGCRLAADLERPAELTDAETARRLPGLDRPECEALLLRRLRERQRLGAN